MSGRAVVVVTVLASLAGSAALALIIMAMPGTMGQTLMPWEYVGVLVTIAMASAGRPLIGLGLGGLAAAAILGATIWLSRRVPDGRPG
jgi:hypothetical protein